MVPGTEVVTMRVHVLSACCLSLLLGCAGVSRHGPLAGAEPFERTLAAATPERPRPTAGDVVVLKDGSLLAAWTDFSAPGQDH